MWQMLFYFVSAPDRFIFGLLGVGRQDFVLFFVGNKGSQTFGVIV